MELRQHRWATACRLCTPSSGKFSVIFAKISLKYVSIPASILSIWQKIMLEIWRAISVRCCLKRPGFQHIIKNGWNLKWKYYFFPAFHSWLVCFFEPLVLCGACLTARSQRGEPGVPPFGNPSSFSLSRKCWRLTKERMNLCFGK